ncbi:hypothetical protein SLA2020_438240 [Shorea laevis]
MVGIHKGPFFWCLLFNSRQTNSTFVLENHGLGIKQKKGATVEVVSMQWGTQDQFCVFEHRINGIYTSLSCYNIGNNLFLTLKIFIRQCLEILSHIDDQVISGDARIGRKGVVRGGVRQRNGGAVAFNGQMGVAFDGLAKRIRDLSTNWGNSKKYGVF